MLRKKHIYNAINFLITGIFTQGLVASDEPSLFDSASIKTPPKRQCEALMAKKDMAEKDWGILSDELSSAMQNHTPYSLEPFNGLVLRHLVSASNSDSWSIMSRMHLFSVMSFCKAARSKAPDAAAKWLDLCQGKTPERILNYGAISVKEGDTFRAKFEDDKVYDQNATAIAMRKAYGATGECKECDTQFTNMLEMNKIPNGKATTVKNCTLEFLKNSKFVKITSDNRVNVHDATLIRKDSGIALAVRPVHPHLCYSLEIKTSDGEETTVQKVISKRETAISDQKGEASELADTLLSSKMPCNTQKYVYFISNAPEVVNATINAAGELKIEVPRYYEGLIECEVTRMTPSTGRLERHPYFLMVQKRARLSALLYSTIHWRYGFMHYGMAALENTLAMFKFLRVM